ncbi:MAG: hypothetical protein AAFQ58_17735 [Pseudomonadota bacterium]
MDDLGEWHQGDATGFQLVVNPEGLGYGSVTLIVEELSDEYERLVSAGLCVGKIVIGDFASFAQISNPDGNGIVLASRQPVARTSLPSTPRHLDQTRSARSRRKFAIQAAAAALRSRLKGPFPAIAPARPNLFDFAGLLSNPRQFEEKNVNIPKPR